MRETVFEIPSIVDWEFRRSILVGTLAATAVPTVAVARPETVDQNDLEVARRPLEILGRALVDKRIDVHFSKSDPLESSFTIRLEGNEGLDLMAAILVGTVYAGLCTVEDIVSRLEKNNDALDREHIRPVLESEIERLIKALDLLDGDADLEDSFDAVEISEDEGAQCDDEGVIDGDQESAGSW